MAEKLDAVDSFEKNKKAKKQEFKEIKTTSHLVPRKTKMAVEFNDRESASVNLLQ